MPGGTWSPGQAALGNRVENNNQIVNGWLQAQKGLATFPPSQAVTTPGTVASGGTYTNTTGYDVMAYISATTSLGTVTVGTQVIFTAAPGSATMSVYLWYGSSIIIQYTGTLTMHWLAV